MATLETSWSLPPLRGKGGRMGQDRKGGARVSIRHAPGEDRDRRPSVVLVCLFCSAATRVPVDPGLYFGSRAYWECLECQKKGRSAPPGAKGPGR